MKEKIIELISALLDGKTLERNHAIKGDGWYELRSMISTLSSYKYEDKTYFEVKGWGSAFGKAAERVFDVIEHPENWQVVNETKNDSL